MTKRLNLQFFKDLMRTAFSFGPIVDIKDLTISSLIVKKAKTPAEEFIDKVKSGGMGDGLFVGEIKTETLDELLRRSEDLKHKDV